MSDIRSFFNKKKNGDAKSSTKPNSAADDGTIVKQNGGMKSTKNKFENDVGEKKKKKKKIIIDSDSDEDPLPSKLRKQKSNSEDPIPPVKNVKEKEKCEVSKVKASAKKEVLHPTTATAFFGSTPAASSTPAVSSSVQMKRKKDEDFSHDEPPSKVKKSVEQVIDLIDSPKKVKKHVDNYEPKKIKDEGTVLLPSKSPISNINISKSPTGKTDAPSSKKKIKDGEKVLCISPTKSPLKKNDVIEPTPPSHKSEKKSSIAGKLSSKVKESEGFMKNVADPIKVKHDKDSSKAKLSGPEMKNMDALQGYIAQAKEKEKDVKKQQVKGCPDTPKTTTPKHQTPKSKSTPSNTPAEESDATAETPGETPKAKKNNYWAMKSREGPTALGSKELPVLGSDSSLNGLTFVITGVLEAFDREEFVDYIKRYGGKVTGAISGKTSYLIVGREPGESKIAKAEKCNIKHLDEDKFIELVQSKAPAVKKSSPAVKTSPTKSKEMNVKEKKETTPKSSKSTSKTPMSTENDSTPKSSKSTSKTPLSTENDSTIETPGETPKAKKNNYWAMKSREGPSALGSKELPVIGDNCLAGLTFVITGVLDAFDREEFADYIKWYGGKITSAVSGKTSYLIVGREPGESKIAKAEKCNTKRLDEDTFIELMQSKVPAVKKSSSSIHQSPKIKIESPMEVDNAKMRTVVDSKALIDKFKGIDNSKSARQSPSSGSDSRKTTPSSTPSSTPKTPPPRINVKGSDLLWVDKYKPKGMKHIVGQQGDKSNANKLKKWLGNWQANNAPDAPKKNPFAGKEDGSIFKAALLSGPPGVGKTTTASLVCQEMGFSFVEMNASDTRGKKALETEIKESLSNVTVNGMMNGKNNAGRNHVLVMDEVDGMSGNEDRGGMQELIQLIKKSRIPIICMCNDRNHPKMRSLSNYTFDLRFYKPRVEQIKGFALSVAAKEGLKIPPQAIEEVVVGANQDIRQVLHNLQMWSSTSNTLTYDEAKDNARNASKNIKIGSFDIVKKLFSRNDSSKMSIDDRLELFFMDYSFVPLFMQENYLYVNPAEGSGNVRKTLEVMSRAADSIADGNMIEKTLRSTQAWSLLPLHGMFSTVIPTMTMSGYMGQKIEFPQWLGKNSSTSKCDRILQELKMHMAMSSNCMKTDVNLDYLPMLKRRLTEPLFDQGLEATEAAKNVTQFMDDYNLTRDDWDSIIDIAKWGNEADVASKIPSKVKAAFTRTYNKEVHKTPYAVHQVAKKMKAQSSVEDNVLVEEGDDVDVQDEDNDEEKEDITKDAMIKVKKEPKSSSSTKAKPTKEKTVKDKKKGSASGKKK